MGSGSLQGGEAVWVSRRMVLIKPGLCGDRRKANTTCAGAGGASHAQGLSCGCECEECPTALCDPMLGCQLMFRILLDTGWESDSRHWVIGIEVNCSRPAPLLPQRFLTAAATGPHAPTTRLSHHDGLCPLIYSCPAYSVIEKVPNTPSKVSH